MGDKSVPYRSIVGRRHGLAQDRPEFEGIGVALLTDFNITPTGGTVQRPIHLGFAVGSNLTAERTLTITPGDADRTLTISGNATVSQDYSTAGSPQFTSLTLTGTPVVASATAIPAGGTAGLGYKFSSTSNFGIFFGSGAPNKAAAQGSLYIRSDGNSTTTRLYSFDGTSATGGWVPMTAAA